VAHLGDIDGWLATTRYDGPTAEEAPLWHLVLPAHDTMQDAGFESGVIVAT
jgi:hypothetical protein